MTKMIHVIELCMHESFYIVYHLLSVLADRKQKIHVLTLLCSETSDTVLALFHQKVRIIMDIRLVI